MKNEPEKDANKPSSDCYEITVKGALAENWADWFNGMLINFEDDLHNSPHTVLTCKIRDQAELNGILNWLHNMNLTLLKVTVVKNEVQEKE